MVETEEIMFGEEAVLMRYMEALVTTHLATREMVQSIISFSRVTSSLLIGSMVVQA